ncbi:EAL domain-containing protein (putative c-di-GMP-specific phosphodiesterase class I) [Modicisalibacter xianhensis]|uniref:EAL domain-containing protein (Putative c-di-GMP-specific phosphodiesterase class I) n=1 Tax=Modicisalibacter xianhensis TaxID=442341 RepID=A0A4R8FTN6_9GAMM|nr:EAL domain-containing protein [Halomonas xianhensis]TDX26797.1 EAL domain-containing protein (putative c-di-GMP-specific phosphodiesterase class I) [Halomonas xianhensis]
MNVRLAVQPIVSASTGNPLAYEVLARVQNKDRLCSPASLGEKHWVHIDRAVMQGLAVCHDCPGASLPLYLNLSADTLACDDAFAAWCCDAASLCRLHLAGVGIEISEETPGDVLERRWSTLATLNACMILDDYGTGLTCLNHLQAFPWDVCKFEATRLMEGLDEDAINYCREQRIVMIAEKVECPAHQSVMCDRGIDTHQGYFYARPSLLASSCLETHQVIQ